MIISGGKVCDGTGSKPEVRDVLIKDDKIADLGAPGAFAASGEPVISAAGKLVTPGFIDAHGHNDLALLNYPEAKTLLYQGVTTIINGNCGFSPCCVPGNKAGLEWRDFRDYTRLWQEKRPAVNSATLCGHNSLRQTVMGNAPRPAEPEEIKQMRQLLEKNLEAGVAGFSSGLTYFPGKFADTTELKELNAILKNSDKIYATHIRSEGDLLLEALQEAVEIANAGSGRLEISHLKTLHPKNFSKIDALLDTINRLRQSGMDVHADRYPSIYSATCLGQIVPAPYDKITGISEKLKNSPAFQKEITEALKHSERDLPTTILLRCGKTLAELAGGRSIEETGMQYLMENSLQTAAFKAMSEANMHRILLEPWVCTGSDGGAMPLDKPGVKTHPRTIATCPWFFRIVSEKQGTAEAVRRLTSLPAEIFRLPKRGRIATGFYADIVILDEKQYDCAATFASPDTPPAGISQVFVNGQLAFDAARPGTIGRFGRLL